MTTTVAEEHPHLYHYTSSVGLRGILESQELWATNIGYLNDSDEHTGYFDYRLPHVFREAIQIGIDHAISSPEGSRRVQQLGGIEKVREDHLKTLVAAVRQITLAFNEPYVFSFASEPDAGEENDGLLSQWQGYGADGGYAVVFETDPLTSLLRDESQAYQYQIGNFCDVEYYSRLSSHKPALEETKAMEREIRRIARDSLFGLEAHDFEPLFVPISVLACSHKHRGFRHEAEVRIVATLNKKNDVIDLDEPNEKRLKKAVHFRPRNGVLVPFIKLFECIAGEPKKKLPIVKIIVGPHRDRDRRKESVKILLQQLGINADVVVSEIPYTGF